MENPLPSIFISHGAPTLPIEDIPARNFLKELGKPYKNVNSVLCISAHWNTSKPMVNAVRKPDTIHDFYGFPEELYKINYAAPGDLKLAEQVVNLIKAEDIPCQIDSQRGLDHGAWVPLMLMYPDADIPVVQLSIQNHLDPSLHLKVGRALNHLRNENVLVLGSGGAVHPLGYAGFRFGGPTDSWAIEFHEWLTKAVTSGDEHSLTNYFELAPYPERAHPYPDHYIPLVTAFGAAGKGAEGKLIHDSWYAGDLGMAAYQFQNPSELHEG